MIPSPSPSTPSHLRIVARPRSGINEGGRTGWNRSTGYSVVACLMNADMNPGKSIAGRSAMIPSKSSG